MQAILRRIDAEPSYVIEKLFLKTPGAWSFWSRLEHSICPGRSWQAMRTRFENSIKEKMRQERYKGHLTDEEHERFRPILDKMKERRANGWGDSPGWGLFTLEEDLVIIIAYPHLKCVFSLQ